MTELFTAEQKEQLQNMIKDAVEATARNQSKIAAEAAAHAMMNEITKNKKERHDKRLHNTKLLLRNYRMLKQHITSAVYEGKEKDYAGDVDAYSLMNDSGTGNNYIDSIKRSVKRTRMIMAHVDKMLKVYKIYCENSGRPETERHYRVINALYLAEQPQQAQEVADAECIDKRTVYKDIDAAVEILTPLFFGVDGIKADF